MTTLFVGFVALMVVVVVMLSTRYLKSPRASTVTAGLLLWLSYVGLIGYFGVIRNTAMRPPGAVFLFGPVVVFLVFFVWRMRRPAGVELAASFPLWILLGTQAFRVIVELFLHQLWTAGLIPKMLTYAGANVDIYVGATAPFIAWWSTRGASGRKAALLWNVLGIFALANVVTRAVLTAPGPLNLIHAETPNLMIGTFPFMFIPGFFVPLAVILHALSLRSIRSDIKADLTSQ